MEQNRASGQGLRVIQGGLERRIFLGSIQVFAAPEEHPPFPVEAVVKEEDTYLVMSAPVSFCPPTEHPIKLLTRLIETRPQEPGSVLVRGKWPFSFLAIVHDFNEEPSWREEWVASALERVFREVANLKLESIALPFLATRHGSLREERFLVLLREAFEKRPRENLKRLWLILQ